MAATDSSEESGDNSGAASHQTSGVASDADSDAHSSGILEAQAYQAKLGRSLCTGCFSMFTGNAVFLSHAFVHEQPCKAWPMTLE